MNDSLNITGSRDTGDGSDVFLKTDPPEDLPTSVSPLLSPAWQREWNASFRNVEGLLEFLGLNPQDAPEALDLNPKFPIRVPRNYARRMRQNDWTDPLLRQVLSLRSESEEHPGFISDAVGDGASR